MEQFIKFLAFGCPVILWLLAMICVVCAIATKYTALIVIGIITGITVTVIFLKWMNGYRLIKPIKEEQKNG